MRFTDPALQPEESELALRPATFEEFDAGHAEAITRPLQVAIASAKARGKPLEHILLTGPPGLGKTTLAGVIAQEMAAEFVHASGQALSRPGDLVGVVTNIPPGGIFFIDEVHRLSPKCAEFLYPVLEDSKLSFVLGKADEAKVIEVPVGPFTVIGATTLAGRMSAPFRDRFGLYVELDFLRREHLAEILLRTAPKLPVDLSKESALAIAACSRGTPRIAKRLLRRVRDYALVLAAPVTDEVVQATLADLGIDDAGLDPGDRRYLQVLATVYNGGPAGLHALAASLNVEAITLAESVEPFLLRKGFVRRTGRGRELTDRGQKHLLGERKPPAPPPKTTPPPSLVTSPMRTLVTLPTSLGSGAPDELGGSDEMPFADDAFAPPEEPEPSEPTPDEEAVADDLAALFAGDTVGPRNLVRDLEWADREAKERGEQALRLTGLVERVESENGHLASRVRELAPRRAPRRAELIHAAWKPGNDIPPDWCEALGTLPGYHADLGEWLLSNSRLRRSTLTAAREDLLGWLRTHPEDRDPDPLTAGQWSKLSRRRAALDPNKPKGSFTQDWANRAKAEDWVSGQLAFGR